MPSDDIRDAIAIHKKATRLERERCARVCRTHRNTAQGRAKHALLRGWDGAAQYWSNRAWEAEVLLAAIEIEESV